MNKTMIKRWDIYKPQWIYYKDRSMPVLTPGGVKLVSSFEDKINVIKPEPRIINLKELTESK